MKKALFIILSILPYGFTAAQNTFPSSGNVGIGTTSPGTPLDVAGEVRASGGFRTGSSLGDNINAAPWYGLGNSNLTLPGSPYPATQLAGYWGLNFQTSTGQMVMNMAGNVGIGTTGPIGKLSVASPDTGVWGLGPGTWSNAYALFGQNSNNVNGAALGVGYSTTDDVANIVALAPSIAWKPLRIASGTTYFAINGVTKMTLDGAGQLSVNGVINSSGYMSNSQGVYVDGGTNVGINNNAGFQYLSFRTNGIDNRMVIDPSGKIGIGNSSPSYKLQVHGPDGGPTVVFANDNFASNNGLDGSLFINSNSSTKIATLESGGANSGLAFATNASGSLVSAMNIISNGNVGIGTTVPDQLLTVLGTIHAKQVNVDLSVPGPDYVFDKNYKLKPLSQVSRYVAQNKHLPEIPSAATMEKTGINVGDLNMKLLKKVEELTLYLIEKDKQVNDLKNQLDQQIKVSNQSNRSLQDQLNMLKQQLNTLSAK
jgi:hypothetical protein